MPVGDSVTSWFIRNIVLPNAEDITHPGYILSKFSEGGQTISLREFFFPESFYVEFEKSIAKKFGKKGEAKLYSVGKRFGYRYAVLSYFKKYGDLGKKKFQEFLYMFVRYIEVIYAKKLQHKMDAEKKLLELTADSYVCCEKNGYGYLLLIGAWLGIWAFLMDDKKIEGVQVECQGRGDKRCKLVCKPNGTSFTEENMDDLEEDQGTYALLNTVHPSTNDNYSLKELIENQIFTYQSGRLFFDKERMVGIEASLYYMVDNAFSDKSSNDILFTSAFNSGKKISVGKDVIFVQRFLACIGFGDVQIIPNGKKFQVIFNHFPWTRFSEECKFTLLAGFTSGLLSGCTGKKISFTKISKSVEADGFHVQMA
ncbi:MAG: hypothetical protein ABH842_00300 [Candidatus Micrarchaeota archaeon]